MCKIWEKKRQPDWSPETLDSSARPSSTNIHDTKICDNKRRGKQKELKCERKKTTRIKWSEMKWEQKSIKESQENPTRATRKAMAIEEKERRGPKEEGNERRFRSECRENRTCCCCCCCCPRGYIPVLAGSWISAGSGQVISLSSGLVWSGQVIRLSSRVVWSGQVWKDSSFLS